MNKLIIRFGVVSAGVTALSGIIAPVLYLLFMDKGMGLIEMGMLLATSTFCAAAFEIPFGSLADRIGRKKVFLIGEACLFFVVIGFWLVDSFKGLLLIMFINGLSTALFSGTIDALFVERFNQIKDSISMNLMEAQAQVGIFQVLGLAVGSIFAGLLPGWLAFISDETSYIGFYEINFVLLIPFILLHMFVTDKFIEESAVSKRFDGILSMIDDAKQIMSNSAKELSLSPVFKVLLLMEFLGGVAFISLEQLWQPTLSELIDEKENTWIFGVIYAFNFVFMGIGQGLSIPLGKLFKHDYAPMLLILELILGGLFLVFAFQESLTGFIVVYFLINLLSGMVVAPNMTMFHEKVREEYRSTMLSIKSLITQAGAMFGALVAGVLAHNYGMSVAWIAAGIIGAAAALFYLVPSVLKFSKEMSYSLLENEKSEGSEELSNSDSKDSTEEFKQFSEEKR